MDKPYVKYFKAFFATLIILPVLILIYSISNSLNIIESLKEGTLLILFCSLFVPIIMFLQILFAKHKNKNIYDKPIFSKLISQNGFEKEIVGGYNGLKSEIENYALRIFFDWENVERYYEYYICYIYFQSDDIENQEYYLKMNREANYLISTNKFFKNINVSIEIKKRILIMTWDCQKKLFSDSSCDIFVEHIHAAINFLKDNNVKPTSLYNLNSMERIISKYLLPKYLIKELNN